MSVCRCIFFWDTIFQVNIPRRNRTSAGIEDIVDFRAGADPRLGEPFMQIQEAIPPQKGDPSGNAILALF